MQQAQDNTKKFSLQDIERLANNVPGVLYSATLSPDPRIDYITNNAADLTGYTVDELGGAGSYWSDIIEQKYLSRYNKTFERCQKTGKACAVEYRITTKDGLVKDVLDRVQPIFDDKGQVVGVDGMIMDITERKMVQDELEKNQMFQTLGKLGAGISHEINTPIQFISDNTHFLTDSLKQVFSLMDMYTGLRDAAVGSSKSLSGDDFKQIIEAEAEADIDFLTDEIPQALAQSLEGMNRVLGIVTAMRDFSHVDDRSMAPADINKAMKSTIIILRNELKYVAEVKTEFDPALPLITCSMDEISQVCMNLLINAAHSIADIIEKGTDQRGVITVKTGIEDGRAIISISDTGAGIADDVREKIFEPFFTTKEVGKGTGQGLAFARSIILEKHNGDIELDTELGKGATFRICLPLETEELPEK